MLRWILIGLVAFSLEGGSPIVVVEGGGYFPVMVGCGMARCSQFFGAALRTSEQEAGWILQRRRTDAGGRTWSKPMTAVDGPEDDRNAALGQLQEGTVALAFATLSGYEADGLKLGQRKFDGVFVMRSQDGGKTWTKPEKAEATSGLHKGPASLSPFGKIVQLADGTALMAVYYTVSRITSNGLLVTTNRPSRNLKCWRYKESTPASQLRPTGKYWEEKCRRLIERHPKTGTR